MPRFGVPKLIRDKRLRKRLSGSRVKAFVAAA